MDFLTVAPGSNLAHFFVLTYLRSLSSDRLQHILKVQMVGQGGIVADAPEHKFLYGYALDANSPGGFVLTTEFNLNLTNLGALGTYYVQALVDGAMVQQAPLTLRRRG